jgi:CRP-like cAMP-binding protein/DNA-directed RNA polymerase subunit RPC12/RpoP
MIFRAELSCLNCGYDVGEVEGERGAAVEDVIFLPVHQGDRLLTDAAQRLRCPRCGGQILSQGTAPVRHPLDPATVCEAGLAEGLGSVLLPKMAQRPARFSHVVLPSREDEASIELENSGEPVVLVPRKEAGLREVVTLETGGRLAHPADLPECHGGEEGDELLLSEGGDGEMYLISRRPHPVAVHESPVLPPRPAIVPFLRHVPLFASLDTEQLLGISAHIVTRQVARGELVTFEGQPVEAVYVVASGSFKRFKTSRKGREQILHLLSRGDSFGEVPLLDGGDDFASTQALERGVLYALPRSQFGALLCESSNFARALNRFLAARVRRVTDLAGDLSFGHVLEGAAKLVLDQSADASRPHLTQSDMAGVTGTTREVLARALRELECRGAIMVRRGHISVCDWSLLRQIAGYHQDGAPGVTKS